jgi:hypothetical protein
MDWRELIGGTHEMHSSSHQAKSSVVVNDFDLMGIAFFPGETNSILIVNPDAKLPFPVASELFQPIPWRDGHILQPLHGMQLA